jgi:hypothetical protein
MKGTMSTTHQHASEPQSSAEETEETTFLRAAGQRATSSAREALRNKNIGFVYGQDGAVLRCNPDGTREVLHNSPLPNDSDPIRLASAPVRYLGRFGLIEGSADQQRVARAAVPLLQALHHVLAGGKVKVEITHQGDPAIVRELDLHLEQSLNDIPETQEVKAARRAVP